MVFTARGSQMTLTISNITTVAALIFLSLIFIFLFFFYLYIHFYWGSWLSAASTHRLSGAGAATRGLDPAVLRSLPISIIRPIDLEHGLECCVCLSVLASGEAARFLPKCSHGFHLACIDKWFRSHSTCPLCRCPVRARASSAAEVPQPAEDVRFELQGEDSGSSSSTQRIPIRSTEGWLPSSVSPLPTSMSQLEELKSP